MANVPRLDSIAHKHNGLVPPDLGFTYRYCGSFAIR
jgi:hypothetical protein